MSNLNGNPNKRAKISDNAKSILLTQVEYKCPICMKNLIEIRKGQRHVRCEIAHIYPHSPTPEEFELLKDVERLSPDPESLDNLIPLCKNCHGEFDHPRTVEGYEKMFAIKQRVTREQKLKDLYSSEVMEEEIIAIVRSLGTLSEENIQKLTYDVVKVDDKLKSCKNNIFKGKLKHNIAQYFPFVQQQFREIDMLNPGQFDIIASQIKLFYLKASQIEKDEETIFAHIVEWMSKQTNSMQNAALEVIVSFFVQNCEVFSVATQ